MKVKVTLDLLINEELLINAELLISKNKNNVYFSWI